MGFALTTKEIHVTDVARHYFRGVLAGAPSGSGLRLSVRSGKGCGGSEYDLSIVPGALPGDECLQVEADLAIFIPVQDTLKLFGATIDYHTDAMGNARIDIRNPNEKGRCGCGESVVL